MNLAAVDIGTNSCRLLITEASTERMIPLYRDLETSRIGEGVAHSLLLKPEAMERTINCLRIFYQAMRSYQVEKYRVVATSAVREALNRSEFINRVDRELSLKVDVISGEEEAWLSYQGVCLGLNLSTDPLVADLGGGSTELVWRENGKLMLLSLPVGAVRAAEEVMSEERIVSILRPLRENRSLYEKPPLVFVGGTATSALAIKLGLNQYDREAVHGHTLKLEEIEALYKRLQSMSPSQLSSTPGVQKKRADIITPGILVMGLVIREMGKQDVIVSESDLLDAIVWQIYKGSAPGGSKMD